MYDLVSLGEALIRLYPSNFQRIEQANNFNISIGGSELNIAVGLSRLGLKACWVSRLPKNSLGYLVRNKAREQGVDVSKIIWCENERVGIYYLEFGAFPRNSKIIYDRKNSSFSKIDSKGINWEDLLKNTKVFMVSGITLALSENTRNEAYKAVEIAKKNNCVVCIDLNYRHLLWSQEKAKEYMEPLMYHTDILITTEEDTFRVLKIQGKDYKEVAQILNEKYKIPTVAITLRENISVWVNNWTAIAFNNQKIYETKTYRLELVDRVGGGDSFTAGFIFGYLDKDIQMGLDCGVAFSSIKQTHTGDFCISNLDEVNAVIKEGSLRIDR